MKLHLLDGTYELFRAYYALPSLKAPNGQEVAAVRGLMQTVLALLWEPGVTHLACAFDHVVESFRNELFPGYKTGAGVPSELMAQFDLAERAAAALGVPVWPMVEFEADDALASAAARWSENPQVGQVVICSPDKDLAQCVRGNRVICLDRRRQQVLDEVGVVDKFGVGPRSIPDYLALVGDAADGIPGLPGWGAKSTAQVLSHYGHLEAIPDDAREWAVKVRGAAALATTLAAHMSEALLYKQLATLSLDVPLREQLGDLAWRGVLRGEFEPLCGELGFTQLRTRQLQYRDD